jgi:hypothetical protein
VPTLRSLPAALAPLLIAAALAGCGPFGGDGEGGEEEFASSGDEICADARAEIAELQRDLPRTAGEQARFTERLLGIFESELAELQQLQPPDDRRAAFERYLRARERAIGYVEDGLAAAKAGNALAYADAQGRVASEQVERTKLAHQAGFTECSRPLTAAGNVSP